MNKSILVSGLMSLCMGFFSYAAESFNVCIELKKTPESRFWAEVCFSKKPTSKEIDKIKAVIQGHQNTVSFQKYHERKFFSFKKDTSLLSATIINKCRAVLPTVLEVVLHVNYMQKRKIGCSEQFMNWMGEYVQKLPLPDLL